MVRQKHLSTIEMMTFNRYFLVYVMVEHGIVRRNIVHEHVQYLEHIMFKLLMEKIIMSVVIVNTF